MLTGKKYRYGSALWRIMLLAQVSMMPSAYAGGGVMVVRPDSPSTPSFSDAAGKAAAAHIHPELAKAARAYHAQYQTLPDTKAINAKAAVMTQISAAGDAIKHGLKTPDLGKMNPFTSKAMVMRELPKAAQAMLEKMSQPVNLPEAPTFKVGSARIEKINHTMLVYPLVQEGDSKSRTSIGWDKFSVGEGNTFVVHQTPGSILLNTVTGRDKSAIAGLIDVQAGHTWISNPNGFDLKDTAKIGADLITTKITTDENFLAKTILFEDSLLDNGSSEIKVGKVEFATPGKWVNLVASNVSQDANTLLAVPAHQTTISNAQVFTIDPDGDGMITTAVDLKRLSPEVREQIMAQAASGDKDSWVVMGRDDLVHAFKGAISMNAVEASNVKVDAKSGSIRLMGDNVTVTGKLSATGQGTEGGTIYVTGQNVNVGSKAHIDVSGDTGGGKIAVGGANTKGYDPEAGKLPKAKNTTIAEGAILEASARINGPAGIVNTWADDLNKDGSTIVAKGGPKEGPKPNDGPKIERSAAEVLDVRGSKFDVKAGSGGASPEITFDPANIVVNNIVGGIAAPNATMTTANLGIALAAGDVTLATADASGAPINAAGSGGTAGGWLPTNTGNIGLANGGTPPDFTGVAGTHSLSLVAGGNINIAGLKPGAHPFSAESLNGNVTIGGGTLTGGSASILLKTSGNGTVAVPTTVVLGSGTTTLWAAGVNGVIDLTGANITLGNGDLLLKSAGNHFVGVTSNVFTFAGTGVVKVWNGTGYTQMYPPLPPAPPVPIPGGGIVPPGANPEQALALANVNRSAGPPLGYIGGSGYMPGLPPLGGPMVPPPGGSMAPSLGGSMAPGPISGPAPQGGMIGPMAGPMGPVGPMPAYSNISVFNAPVPMGAGMPLGMPSVRVDATTALAGPSITSLGAFGLTFAPPSAPPSGSIYGGAPVGFGGMPGTPTPGGPLGASTSLGDTRGTKASSDNTVESGSTSEESAKPGAASKVL